MGCFAKRNLNSLFYAALYLQCLLPKDKTYTDTELEALMNKVIVEVGKKTGAVLR